MFKILWAIRTEEEITRVYGVTRFAFDFSCQSFHSSIESSSASTLAYFSTLIDTARLNSIYTFWRLIWRITRYEVLLEIPANGL